MRTKLFRSFQNAIGKNSAHLALRRNFDASHCTLAFREVRSNSDRGDAGYVHRLWGISGERLLHRGEDQLADLVLQGSLNGVVVRPGEV